MAGSFGSMPDHDHPNGGVICIKGKAAPELVYNQDRLDYPLRRTRPKGDPDPDGSGSRGTKLWMISRGGFWKFASATARNPSRLPKAPRAAHLSTMPSVGWDDCFISSAVRIGCRRRMFAIGTKIAASATPSARIYRRPILSTARAFLLWGHNPSSTSLILAHDIVQARSRGMKTVVIDPRRIGIGAQADMLLQPRPGTDGALALALIHCLMEESWYDAGFARQWTNGVFLLNAATNRLVAESEISSSGSADRFVVWDEAGRSAGGL